MKTAKSLSASQEISLVFVGAPAHKRFQSNEKKATNPTKISAITSPSKIAQTFVISGPAINSANAALDFTDHSDSVPFNNEEK